MDDDTLWGVGEGRQEKNGGTLNCVEENGAGVNRGRKDSGLRQTLLLYVHV